MTSVRLLLIAGAAGLLCGCGTLYNVAGTSLLYRPEDPSKYQCTLYDDHPRNFVYGGVTNDAEAIHQFLFEEEAPLMKLLVPVCVADIPVSAVFDTLTLPMAIAATRREKEWWRKRGMKEAQVEDERSVHGTESSIKTTGASE